MKFKSFLVALAVGSLSVQAQQLNPITKAMMEVYQQELDADPQNYEVYFRRANEYYNTNQYLRALSDIDNAIRYTPVEDTDLLFQEYTLRGNILLETGRAPQAIDDFSKALEIDPSSFSTLQLRAYTAYKIGKYQDAKQDYNRLLRYDPHSIEPLIGLARIAVKENNIGLATEYTDRAVSFGPSNGASYMGRAEVKELMNNNTGAVEDLLLAISVDSENSRAVARLVEMSGRDYNAVISGLTNAIQQAPSVGMFVYMRATIAMAHYRYRAAIEDYRTIIDQNLYNYHGINAALARCYYALGKYQEALAEIGEAISMTSDNGEYLMTRAMIRRAMGDYDKALQSAGDALAKLPGNVEAMRVKALCAKSAGQLDEASDLLGEAIMDAPDEAITYLDKAYLLANDMKSTTAAANLYQRAEQLDVVEGISSLRGFVLIGVDKMADAISWYEGIASITPDNDGAIGYYGACLYAQVGQTDKALKCMENALENGYANYHNWTREDDSLVSVAPLRSNPKFKQLLEQYKFLF